jgi:hypothetical protein
VKNATFQTMGLEILNLFSQISLATKTQKCALFEGREMTRQIGKLPDKKTQIIIIPVLVRHG